MEGWPQVGELVVVVVMMDARQTEKTKRYDCSR